MRAGVLAAVAALGVASCAHKTNTIAGDAVLRTRGGDVKTCAGLPVVLMPAGPQTNAYVQKHFGGPEGYETGGSAPSAEPELEKLTTSKVCNAQGQFLFDGLADGDYYVIATVTWEVPTEYSFGSNQGGDIAKRISVKGGQTANVTLTG